MIDDDRLFADPVAYLQQSGLVRDPYPAYARLRAHDGVLHADDGRFVLSTYADVHDALVSRQLSNVETAVRESANCQHMPQHSAWDDYKTLMLPRLDGDDHRDLRHLLRRPFRRDTMGPCRDTVRNAATECIGRMLDAGRGDLVEELCAPIAFESIVRFVGLTDVAYEEARAWAQSAIQGIDPASAQDDDSIARTQSAAEAISALIGHEIRSRTPESPQDVLDHCAIVARDEMNTSHAASVSNAMFFIAAGVIDGQHVQACILHALLSEPGTLRSLRSGEVTVRAVIDECLRFESPVHLSHRWAHADAEIGGTTIPSGSALVLLTGSANRDPHIFEHPDILDIHRPNASEHLSAGAGVHSCLGVPFWFQLCELMLDVIVEATASIEIAVPSAELDWYDLLQFRGPRHLPVTIS